MELVVVRLAKNRPYLFGLQYQKEKTIHFAHEIDDFRKITDTEAWNHITQCIAVMNLSTENCLEIVKVSHDRAGRVSKIIRKPTAWNTPFVRTINAGDSIEIRFRGDPHRSDIHCFEVRQVHVNLNEGEEYRLGSATHGFGRDYDNRITCEFTQYIYISNPWVVLQTDFVTNTVKFPLVKSVARDDCMEVVVKRYSNAGESVPQTIWQQGHVLQLETNLTIFDRDVIEIRLLKRNKPEKRYDEDKGENTDESEKGDEPDEDESSDDESNMDCVVCFEGRREVVLKPCGHCCVCKKCSDEIEEKARRDNEARKWKYEETQDALCPICRIKIESVVKISDWKEIKPIVYVTCDMDDVYSLLTRLQRHCV